MDKNTDDDSIMFTEIGKRLKKIRTDLKFTLDKMSHASKISRSSIADFERGSQFPNKFYLKYLFDFHNANLHFILGGEGSPFRPSKDEGKSYSEFGRYSNEVKEMLDLMNKIPHAMFYMLSCIAQYKVIHRDFISMSLSQQEIEEKNLDQPSDSGPISITK